jgi:putative transcriptional regulator
MTRERAISKRKQRRAVPRRRIALSTAIAETLRDRTRFGKELIASMEQAATHATGRKVRSVRVTKVEMPDVKAIRRSLRMSQQRFAAAYRIPLPTLKNWEQGRRLPDAPAAAYLLAIKRRPKEIMEAVAH